MDKSFRLVAMSKTVLVLNAPCIFLPRRSFLLRLKINTFAVPLGLSSQVKEETHRRCALIYGMVRARRLKSQQ